MHVPVHNGCRCVLGCAAPPAQPARALGSMWADTGPMGPPLCVVWAHLFFTLCLGSSERRGSWAGCPLPEAAVGAGRMGLGDRYRPACRLRLWFPAGGGGEGAGEPGGLLGGCRAPPGGGMMAAVCLGPPAPVLGALLGKNGVAAAGVMLAGFWEVCCSMLTEHVGAWAVHQCGMSP